VDLTVVDRTLTASRDLSFFANKFGWGAQTNATIRIANCVKATHYPEGYVKPGTFLAKVTSGANTGVGAPWVEDDAGGVGLNTLAGMVFSGFEIREVDGVAVATKTSGSIILKGTPVHVYVSKLPGLLLANGSTANPILAADVATMGFVAVTP